MVRDPLRAGSLRFAAVLLLCLGSRLAAQSGSETYAGRRLEEVLRTLQATGLRIIFTSELVTRDMRVQSEPRATVARERLDEILRPHGLGTKTGPADVIQIVRRKRSIDSDPSVSAPKVASRSPARASITGGMDPAFSERVVVTGSTQPPAEQEFGAPRRLNLSLDAAGGALVDDPLHVAHTLPGVMAGDDFRSELSVRGSPYRHTAVVVDGVSTPWLTHGAAHRGVAASLSMLQSDVVDRAELYLGAYPRRHGNTLGAQLDLTLAEGSRTSTRFRATVSSTNTSVTGQGPIGRSGRGSWLLAARQSHTEWPLGRDDHDSTVFGFADVLSKLVYDASAGQQVTFSLVGGRSAVEREAVGAGIPADGMNRAVMLTAGWRSLSRRGFVVQQRASLVTHTFSDIDGSGQQLAGGNDRALGYRVNVTAAIGRTVAELGGHVERLTASRNAVAPLAFSSPPGAFTVDQATWLVGSAHAHIRWNVTPRVVVAPGLRFAESTLLGRQAVDRWLLAEWSLTPGWKVHASSGVVHQFASLEHLPVAGYATRLRPERAVHVDVGFGHRLSDSIAWDVSLFSRRERDILGVPDEGVGFVDGHLVLPEAGNELAGSAHGMELRLERRRPTGFSGWVGYAYGHATYTDSAHSEVFPADLDQRHGLILSGVYRWFDRLTASAVFRAGSSVPVTGYLGASPGGLFADTERNRIRLPVYARLDLRLERSFRADNGRRFAVFCEMLNALNRTNIGAARGAIRHDTGQATGFTEQLFPRLFSVGVRAEF